MLGKSIGKLSWNMKLKILRFHACDLCLQSTKNICISISDNDQNIDIHPHISKHYIHVQLKSMYRYLAEYIDIYRNTIITYLAEVLPYFQP